MEYEIIFYHAGKTFETERLLTKKLSQRQLHHSTSTAAAAPEELAEALQTALGRCSVVLIIGGLDGSRHSTDSILSVILSAQRDSLYREKIVDESDNIAYYIRAQQQCILLMPDDPNVIEEMFEKRLLSVLEQHYALQKEADTAPLLTDVTEKLNRQLQDMDRHPSDYHDQIVRQQQSELKHLRWGITAAAITGCLLLLASLLTFLIR